MKIAAAAYPLDFLSDWDTYEEKTRTWVDRAAEAGADLLVFPEYGRMELATLDGAEAAGDLERSLHAAARWTEKADALIDGRPASMACTSSRGPARSSTAAKGR
jgi:predicted amidohydrolase